MPTVLQVLPSLAGGGGVERGTLDISRALAAAGWRSLIASEGEADREQAAAAGARHAALPLALAGMARVLRGKAGGAPLRHDLPR